jgi:hypothetical protein
VPAVEFRIYAAEGIVRVMEPLSDVITQSLRSQRSRSKTQIAFSGLLRRAGSILVKV